MQEITLFFRKIYTAGKPFYTTAGRKGRDKFSTLFKILGGSECRLIFLFSPEVSL